MARWLALDTVERFEQWRALAMELAAAQERALGGPTGGVGSADPAPVFARLLARLPGLGADSRGLLPLDVLAEAGVTRAGLAADPGGAAATRVRRTLARRALQSPVAQASPSELVLARSYLARRALERMAGGREPARAATPGVASVLGLWRTLRRYRARR